MTDQPDYSQALSVLPGLDTVLGSVLQDSIMYLCITDNDFLKLTRNLLPLEFAPGTVYRKILSLLFDYWDRFQCAPSGQMETELNWALESKQLTEQEYSQAVDYQLKLSKMEPPSSHYVLERLSEFSLQRRWFVSGIEFVKLVRSGKLEEGRSVISKSLREGVGATLDSGIDILDADSVTDRIIRRATSKPYLMNWMIEPFDRYGIVLYRGDYILIAAPEKLGKSWAGVHIGKVALIQSLNVLHCSQGDLYGDELEDRYDQCFTSSFHWRKKAERRYAVEWFDKDDIVSANIKVESISDGNVVKRGVRAVKTFGGKLVVKWWPMGVCTLPMFEGYLDHLAVNENFIPDVIINDYGAVMALRSHDREGIEDMNVAMRRISGERRALVVNFSQVTAKAYSKKWITIGDFAEDKRYAAHCSGAYALCRTTEETKLGKGRFVLFVDRHFGLTGFCAEMIMDYDLGQFCKSARKLRKIEDGEDE